MSDLMSRAKAPSRKKATTMSSCTSMTPFNRRYGNGDHVAGRAQHRAGADTGEHCADPEQAPVSDAGAGQQAAGGHQEEGGGSAENQ